MTPVSVSRNWSFLSFKVAKSLGIYPLNRKITIVIPQNAPTYIYPNYLKIIDFPDNWRHFC